MKTLITLMLILSTTFSSYAANEDVAAKKKERFAKVKSMALSNIDKRASALQQTKSCIAGASDKAAMKKCHQEAKRRNQAFRDEMKQKRKEMRAQFGGGKGHGQRH